MTFESALDTIRFINPNRTDDALIREFLSVIQRYMRWSFLINERNSGIYREFLERFYTNDLPGIMPDPHMLSFCDSDIAVLEKIRLFLARKEEEYQVSSALS